MIGNVRIIRRPCLGCGGRLRSCLNRSRGSRCSCLNLSRVKGTMDNVVAVVGDWLVEGVVFSGWFLADGVVLGVSVEGVF